MPWVQMTTAKTLDGNQRKSIAGGVAESLNKHIDKDPAGVFVSFVTADEFYWSGSPSDNAAMFDLRWIGEFSAEQKKAIAADICGTLAPSVGIDTKKTRVVFTSKTSDDWGRV